MSMKDLNNDKVNVILEYKKIYDECDVESKIKVLGNIQKYQMDMLNFIRNQTQLNSFRLTGCFYDI
ncbi:hypothetical protein HpHUE38_01090 [Helicobacter pylori]